MPDGMEYAKLLLSNYKGIQICSLADISVIKGYSTNRYALFFKYWNRIHYRKILPLSSKIVTISYYTKGDLMTLLKNRNINVTTIYNGIDEF